MKDVQSIVDRMWRSMHYRCKCDPAYAGIEVRIPRVEFRIWAKRELVNFLHLYPGVQPSIDRLDYDNHYEFGNVRIADNDINRITSRFVSRFMRLADKPSYRRLHVTKVLAITLCKQLGLRKSDLISELQDCRDTDFFV